LFVDKNFLQIDLMEISSDQLNKLPRVFILCERQMSF
jgi:hypothetical protein